MKETYHSIDFEDKIEQYTVHWEKYHRQMEQALGDAFKVDVSGSFNNIKGFITLNPISPRYLAERSFDIFYLNGPKGALATAIHEIIHFIWFDCWQKFFADSAQEYESPHLKWIFSEMAVDPIIRHDPRLYEINPVFEQGGVAYKAFYTMSIEGRPILQTLYDMYTSLDLPAFMKEGYAYLHKWEGEIRLQSSIFLG